MAVQGFLGLGFRFKTQKHMACSSVTVGYGVWYSLLGSSVFFLGLGGFQL